jgi:2-polyprenyl-6-methoxyphenol hydroxylase-like FAD-dependent oxidoreductase
MAGAYALAEELAATPGDHESAFRRYETAHRKLADPKQEDASRAVSLMIPATRRGIVIRNLATRLWPAGAAVSWLRRRLRQMRTAPQKPQNRTLASAS